MALCCCAIGNVGLKVCREKVELPKLSRALSICLKFCTSVVKIGTGSRISLLKDPFRISFWGRISASDQGIFTKFGECVDNVFPQGV